MVLQSPPPAVIGDYHVIHALDAEAGMGRDVYLALQESATGSRRLHVVKLLAARGLARAKALRELKQARRMTHQAAAPVGAYFEHERDLAVVFEYLEGLRLDQIQEHLERERERLSDQAIWYVGFELCGALAEAHALADDRGRRLHMAHGVLGPDQVHLSWDGAVRVYGIGLPSVFEDAERSARARAYHAPLRSEGAFAGARADAYAAAAIMWSLLAGRRVSAAQLDKLTALRPEIPRELAEAIDAALDLGPLARGPTCAELAGRIVEVFPKAKGPSELRWNMEVFRALSLFSKSHHPPGSDPPPAEVPPPISQPRSHWERVAHDTPWDGARDDDRTNAFEGAEDSVVERLDRISTEFDGSELDWSKAEPAPTPRRSSAPATRRSTPEPIPPAPAASGPAAAPTHDASDSEAVLSVEEVDADDLDLGEEDVGAFDDDRVASPPGPTPSPPPSPSLPTLEPLPPPSPQVAPPAERAAPPAAMAVPAKTPAATLLAEPAVAAAPAAVLAPTPAAPVAAAGDTAAPRKRGVGIAALAAVLAVGVVAVVASRWFGADGAAPALTATASAAPSATSSARATAVGGAPPASGQGGAVSSAAASDDAAVADYPAVAGLTEGDGKDLLSYEGYLVVRSHTKADVFVQGVHVGSTNAKVKSRCYQKFVRLRDPASGAWLTDGAPVRIACMSLTTVTIDP